MTMTEVEPQVIGGAMGMMPRIEVSPPPMRPWPFGLSSVATMRSSAERDPQATMWPDLCAKAHQTQTVMCGSTPDKIAAATDPSWSLSVEPFVVWVADTCAPVGRGESEAEDRARTLLEWGQDSAIAAKILSITLSTGLLTTDVGAAGSPHHALGLLECCMRSRRPTQGVIMMPALTATLVSDTLEVQGDRLFTRIGTPVWINDCEELGGDFMLGTGPIVVDLGPIETLTAMNRERNERVVIAERVIAVGVGCEICKATVPLPAGP